MIKDINLDVMLKKGLDISPDCFGIINRDDVVVYCNNTFASIFGHTKQEAIGQTNKALLKHSWSSKTGIIVDTDDFDSWYKKVNQKREEQTLNQFESDLTDGRWFKITRVTLDDNYTLFFGVNITDLKQTQMSLEKANQQIELLANTDQLTSVNNRRSFYSIAEQELQKSKMNKHVLALLLVDIDHFKKINDNYGHEIGDFILKEFAALCKDLLRQSDSISRIGGEEFTVLLPSTNHLQAYQIAEKIRAKVAEHEFYIENIEHALNISISIGISNLIDEKKSIKELMIEADIALYKAKNIGRNQVVEFNL